jgi:hypothetical protein
MQLLSPIEIAEVEAAEKIVKPIEAVPAKRRRTGGSNRVKYRCPSCQSQVWGKPDLLILSGVVACGERSSSRLSAVMSNLVAAPLLQLMSV